MDLQLKNKRALVCASSKGLGFAVADSLAAEGVELYLCARDPVELTKAQQRLQKKHGTKVHAEAIDLARPDSIDRIASSASHALGQIDILVNNIGGPPPSSAAGTSLEAWESGFRQVFLSAALLSQNLVSGMCERGFGRIVTITSLSVLEPIDNLVVSTAMRAAVTTFSKTLAKEVAAAGVTVNTLLPGVIHTGRIEQLRQDVATKSGTTLEQEMEKSRQLIPMRRFGKPEELAALVTFLSSPRAAYITGVNIPVDGGLRKGW